MADGFVGEIRIFAGNYAPLGWVLCNGQALSVNDYQVLYALIGTTYGGTGSTNFKVPNLNATLPIGQGTGTNLTPRLLGASTGVDSVTLTQAHLPAHTHSIMASTTAATTTIPGPTLTLGTTPASFYDNGAAVSTSTHPMDQQALTSVGGNLPHDNHMPTLSLTYIIATTGLFPTRP